MRPPPPAAPALSGTYAQGGGPVPPHPPGRPPPSWAPPRGGQAPPPPFGPPPYGYPPPDFTDQTNLRKEADTWFIVSLISILCCCVLGIVGAILSYQAKDLIADQRIQEAQGKLQAAKIVTVLALAFGMLGALFQLAWAVLAAAMRFHL